MYARCVIVILVVAVAQIFPTGIEACGNDLVHKSYGDIGTCRHGASGIPSCCEWCKQQGKNKCRCTITLYIWAKTVGCKCRDPY